MKILSVILPCYNEARTIETIIGKVQAVSIPNWNIEIVIVDDGSRDGTREILERLQKTAKGIKVIFHASNRGKGSAVKTGIENSSGDYIIIQDADLEYNPAEIPSLINALGKDGSDVIYGSRNLYHIPRKGMYIPRMGVWFITKQFNFLYRAKLTDLWTCYKLFPRKSAHLFVPGGFESELVFSAKLAKAGYKIAEVPVSCKSRTVAEGKKIRYRDGVRGIWLLLIERFRR